MIFCEGEIFGAFGVVDWRDVVALICFGCCEKTGVDLSLVYGEPGVYIVVLTGNGGDGE